MNVLIYFRSAIFWKDHWSFIMYKAILLYIHACQLHQAFGQFFLTYPLVMYIDYMWQQAVVSAGNVDEGESCVHWTLSFVSCLHMLKMYTFGSWRMFSALSITYCLTGIARTIVIYTRLVLNIAWLFILSVRNLFRHGSWWSAGNLHLTAIKNCCVCWQEATMQELNVWLKLYTNCFLAAKLLRFPCVGVPSLVVSHKACWQ